MLAYFFPPYPEPSRSYPARAWSAAGGVVRPDAERQRTALFRRPRIGWPVGIEQAFAARRGD